MKQNPSHVQVTLDIFSGRPNPQWALSETQIEELRRRLVDLKEEEATTPPGLGYRGFLVTNAAQDRRLPEQVRSHNGVVTLVRRGVTRSYADSNGIETWLIQQANERGYEDVLKRFRGEESGRGEGPK